MTEVIGSVFNGPNQPGDFAWMIRQPEYDDAFFVFNDNEAEFRRHQQHGADAGLCRPGGGNAVIRPYQCRSPQRAAGVPTGDHSGGYPALTDHVRDVIDSAIEAVAAASSGFDRVFHSADRSGELGTGIFAVDDAVKRYIVEQLRELGSGRRRWQSAPEP